MRTSTLRLVPLALAVAALSACASASSGTAPEAAAGSAASASAKPEGPEAVADAAPEAASTRSTLPDFTLETTEGDRFRLSDHVGNKVIVMSFWATWCNPCMAELPHLDDLYNEEKEKGLLIVAVAMDEPGSVAQVAPTAARLGLTMPVVLDTDQRAVRLYNRSRDAPRTVVINRKGEIVRSSTGYNPGDEEKLRAEVMALLAQ